MMMEAGLGSDSRNRPGVDNTSKSKLDVQGKMSVAKGDLKKQLKSESKTEPMRYGNGPQWVPKGSEGVGKRTTDLSKDRASIQSSNQVVINSDDQQVPAKATR
jgi:hypothetical protein